MKTTMNFILGVFFVFLIGVSITMIMSISHENKNNVIEEYEILKYENNRKA